MNTEIFLSAHRQIKHEHELSECTQVQVPKGAGRLLHRPVGLDLYVGPSAIPCEIPVVTGYLMRICEIS